MQKIILIASLVVGFAIYIQNKIVISEPEVTYNLFDILEQSHRATTAGGSRVHRCFPEIRGYGDLHTVYDYSQTRVRFSDGSRAKFHTVDVEATKEPVLIALSSYNSVVWQLNVKPGANIAGILVTSYHESLITGVPEGVSVGKTFFRGQWSDDEEDCYLPGKLKLIRDQMRKAEGRWPSRENGEETSPFRFHQYYDFDKQENIESFQKAVFKLANFRHADDHNNDKKIYDGRFVISDNGKQAHSSAINQAKADLRALGKPSTALKLNVRNIWDKPRKFTNIDTFGDDAIRQGYLKDGKEEYAYYCKYRSALRRLNGMSGEHPCHFHVRYKFEKAFVVLGNFSFPKDLCLNEYTVFLLPPGVQKPYVRHCKGDKNAVLYLDLVDDVCLGGVSECERVREKRDSKRRAEFKRRS